MSDREIVRAINSGGIDAADLVSSEGWRRICQALGRNFSSVDEVAWQDLCARRGYLLSRRNPRGFWGQGRETVRRARDHLLWLWRGPAALVGHPCATVG